MRKIILISFSFLMLVNNSCSKTGNDQITGPLIVGIYEFNSYSDVKSFYSIYENKNAEKFLIPNLDNLNCLVKYYFVSSDIKSDVINNKIYDYDFPSPSFKIPIDKMNLYLFDIPKIDFSTKPIFSIQVNEKNKENYYTFYMDNFELGLLWSEETLETNFINNISNKFAEAL